MNLDNDSPESNPPIPAVRAATLDTTPPAADTSGANQDWRYWARRLLVCNPFFLCSAALLLFGVNRLANDPGFLGDEVHNLLFNFFALQFYEVLVIVTALVLARRRVWYDSALLVVMENGLVLVPFMLISQATMQNDGMTLAWSLTLSGGLLAAVRFLGLTRWYPQFNLPGRALLLGGVILAANVALPLIFRPRMELDTDDWIGPNQFLWHVVIPLVIVGANLLPRPVRYGGSNPERHWLPLFNYALWVIGSAVHVWSIAHICGFPLEWNQLAPAVCVAAWTLWNRLTDCASNPSSRLQQAPLMLAAGAPVLAFAEPRLMLALAGLNAVTFAALSFYGGTQTRATARQLGLASAALLFGAIPPEWGRLIMTGFGREHGVGFGATLYLVLIAIRSRRPEAGLFGAIATGIDAGWLAPGSGVAIGLEAGMVFLILHSLRWTDKEHAGALFLRWMTAIGWMIHAVIWTYSGGWLSMGVTGIGALLVAAGWIVVWRFRRECGLWVIPVAAAIVLLSGPANGLVRSGSGGMAAVVGSFALFGIGVVVAWTRHRWERHETAGREDG